MFTIILLLYLQLHLEVTLESSSLRELRTLVEDLGLGRLGSPCNYTEFLVS